MTKSTGNKIALGTFVALGLALLVVGIFYIGQKQRLFTGTIKIKFLCANVSGLQAGNNVRFSGINVGTVSSVQIISDSAVRVDMILDKDVKKFIKKDSRASVGSEGLMGDKVVDIGPGSPDQAPVENNDSLLYGGGSSLDEIMAQIKIVATNAAHITGDLSDVMANIRNGKGTIGRLFMDTSIAGNLNGALVNIKEGAGGFKQNMDAASHSFLLKGYFKKKEKEDRDSIKRAEKK